MLTVGYYAHLHRTPNLHVQRARGSHARGNAGLTLQCHKGWTLSFGCLQVAQASAQREPAEAVSVSAAAGPGQSAMEAAVPAAVQPQVLLPFNMRAWDHERERLD